MVLFIMLYKVVLGTEVTSIKLRLVMLMVSRDERSLVLATVCHGRQWSVHHGLVYEGASAFTEAVQLNPVTADFSTVSAGEGGYQLLCRQCSLLSPATARPSSPHPPPPSRTRFESLPPAAAVCCYNYICLYEVLGDL